MRAKPPAPAQTSGPRDSSAGLAGHYSPFWPLLVLLGALAVQQGLYLFDAVGERADLLATQLERQPKLAKAVTANEAIERLGRDLMALAPRSPEAATIVADFKMKLE